MSGDVLRTSKPEIDTPPTRLVRGRHAVLWWADRLVALSHRCGLPEAMDRLEADLARPAFARKTPTLILTMGREAGGTEEPVAAVLLYEERFLGVGCRLFSADYLGAVKSVIAPDDQRAHAAFAACELLMRRGALMVHVSYEGEQPRMQPGPRERRARDRRINWAILQRQPIGYLPMEASVDATLANLGKHTRRNLRYYRRRAEAELGQELVVHPRLNRDEFVAFSQVCSHPLSGERAARRHEATEHLTSDDLYLGLRTARGEWLSLLGGRIEGGDTHIEWQMNRADMPSYSLCTVMRAHLIEHEVKRGARRLYFVGGTTHSLRTAMVDVKIADLMVLDYRLPRRLLRRMARPDSFMREMLSNTALEWHRWWRIPTQNAAHVDLAHR